MKTLQNYLIMFIYASTNRRFKQNSAWNISNAVIIIIVQSLMFCVINGIIG